jgi:hypothetical protein
LRKDLARHASWQELLASPAPASHILQIYDSDDFLALGVAHFAAEGLKRGEAVLLTGTEAHLQAVRRALAANDVDYDAALRRAQLVVSDVRTAAASLLADGAVETAQLSDERYSGARWWGEITNFLHQQGDPKAALAAEDLGIAAVQKHGATIFCSFLHDRFDPRGYDGILREVCCKHSHVIPAQDYVRHRLAVNRAIADVVGEIRGPLLQSLMSWKGLSCDLPSSQALLFWLRDALPDHFQHVLARVKAYHADA